MLKILRQTFWILALAVILLFVFFVLLGAFDPADVKGATAAVLALVAAWVVHAIVESRRRKGIRDEASMRARERRGF